MANKQNLNKFDLALLITNHDSFNYDLILEYNINITHKNGFNFNYPYMSHRRSHLWTPINFYAHMHKSSKTFALGVGAFPKTFLSDMHIIDFIKINNIITIFQYSTRTPCM